ncbi:MAG: orotidine-5'-phosphate decarboxylase, partial [Candidatus Hermodarchaeota archaeon]
SIKDKHSVVSMGLDPRLDKEGEIPQFIIDEYDDPNKIVLEFNKTLIDNTYDLIPVIKPQIAFYEKYEAFNALKETIKYAHKMDLLVILDCKRNDIGATSEAYAYYIFNVLNADACTINAYLGIDGVKPFLEFKEKGLFVLVKTSNPSSNDFQNLFSAEITDVSDSETVISVDNVTLERNYIKMARLVSKWGEALKQVSNFHNLGVVVGATFPDELKFTRKIVKNSYILIPGFGAQGATAKDIKNGFYEDGLGAIVNSSRGIIYAYSNNDKYPANKFGEAARAKISEMNKDINKMIKLSVT